MFLSTRCCESHNMSVNIYHPEVANVPAMQIRVAAAAAVETMPTRTASEAGLAGCSAAQHGCRHAHDAVRAGQMLAPL